MNRTTRHNPARPGMTFLEIVFSVALLGILSATLLGAANSMLSRQKHEQRALACGELANRLILQFLDDRDGMPDPTLPLTYGGDQYRWSLEESYLSFRPSRPPPAVEGRAQAGFENFRIFYVRVWHDDPSGSPGAASPSVEVSRMYDVTAVFRNPDALEHMLSTEAGRRRITETSTGIPLGIPPRGTPPAGNGGRPRSGP